MTTTKGPHKVHRDRLSKGSRSLASGQEVLPPEVGRGFSFLVASDPEGQGMDWKVVPQKAYLLMSGYFYHPYKGKG